MGSREGEGLDATFQRLRAASRASVPDLEARLGMLRELENLLVAEKAAIAEAVLRDFGNRSTHETLLGEVLPVVTAIRHARANLADWMSARHRQTNAVFFPSTAQVVLQPLGVVGIISPWNYPLQLALSPFVSALAAGNRVILKPSELSPHTSALLDRLVSKAIPADFAAVVPSNVEVAEAFSRLPFDHLLFTGSTRVGKIVMRAASDNLVPVTLELGGKCPAIVGPEAGAQVAAERIMFGKTFSAGQTCVAPDYALVPSGKKAAFVDASRQAVSRFYPTMAANPDYSAIVNDAHYQRLQTMIEEAKSAGAQLVELTPAGETLDPAARKIAPTLVLDPAPESLCMTEEIFGPVLPIVTYETISAAIAHVNAGPRPLALYYFGHDEAAMDRVLTETTTGAVTFNETMLHWLQDDLPIGGVGHSGMGQYHGIDGFEAFSNKKAVFRHSPASVSRLVRPPYGWAAQIFERMFLGK